MKDVGRGGLGSESAPNQQFESRLLLGIEGRNDAEIVHDAQARVGFRTGKRNLEFAPHFLANRVPQKEPPQRICPREHIEGLIRVQTREGRGGDVAHGVATCFTQGHLALFKLCPELRAVLEFHMVDLNVLPGGQMVFAGGVFVANVEDGPELVKRQQPHGDFDSDHLNAGLPLAVDAARKAQASKPFFIHATFFVEEDAAVEVEDVLLDDGVVDFVDETEHEDGGLSYQKKKASAVGGLCRV